MKETLKNYSSNSVKEMVHKGRLKNLTKKGTDLKVRITSVLKDCMTNKEDITKDQN